MSAPLKIYTARPISGCDYEEIETYYYDLERILLRCKYIVLCPMTGLDYLRIKKVMDAVGYPNHPGATEKAIVSRDKWLVKMSDVVLVDLSSAKEVSIGCIFELAWAHDNGKHTVVVMGEDNVHHHSFVLECADVLFNTLEEALQYLEQLTL